MTSQQATAGKWVFVLQTESGAQADTNKDRFICAVWIVTELSEFKRNRVRIYIGYSEREGWYIKEEG